MSMTDEERAKEIFFKSGYYIDNDIEASMLWDSFGNLIIKAIQEVRKEENEKLKEALKVAEGEKEHCRDCCCARSWKALGINEFTGKSIPEHIEEYQKAWEALDDERKAKIASLQEALKIAEGALKDISADLQNSNPIDGFSINPVEVAEEALNKIKQARQ